MPKMAKCVQYLNPIKIPNMGVGYRKSTNICCLKAKITLAHLAASQDNVPL